MSPYLDHNATTPLRPEARERWLEVASSGAANPSSPHASGRAARAVIDEARSQVAAALGVHDEEVIFTSGGTESINLALRGAIEPGGTLLTSSTEHSAVLETSRDLASRGHGLELVGVDERGALDAHSLAAGLAASPRLVSLQAANNETGAVIDLATVSEQLRRMDPPPIFHTDAVQFLGRLPVELERWGVQLASFSAHKVGGPKGIGVLVRRRGVPLRPVLTGGGQEDGLRPGTEDPAGIAAAALAIELAVREQADYAAHTRALCAAFWADLAPRVRGLSLIGPPLGAQRLPNTLCIHIPGSDGRVLVTRLDLEGLEVSAGSACSSGSIEPSHVLRAMGLGDETARAALRVSFGRNTSHEECNAAVKILARIATSSRAS